MNSSNKQDHYLVMSNIINVDTFTYAGLFNHGTRHFCIVILL